MNGRAVLFVLGNLLSILGVTMLLPLVVALIVDDGNPHAVADVVAFALVAPAAIGIGMLGRYRFRDAADGVRVREGFAIVTFSWILMTVVGMLPYLITGVTDSVADAFFETMSGFTTTGATVFPEVEVMPAGLAFWRCMTQWLGGMGVVVLSVALLPILGVGGYRLLKAETPGGVAFERDRPRITDSAKLLWKLYLAMSVAQVAALMLAGMGLYDAVCHTFTTMSTGGFSPHTESIKYFASPSIHWIIIIFMFLAGANFSLHAAVIAGHFRQYLHNREFRLYVIITLVAVVYGVIFIDAPFGEATVRDVTFQVVSISTTTGYATQDFDIWPHALRGMLFLIMFSGGCMGSTGGGMKVARVLIYAKAVGRELHRLIYPHGVRPLRVGDKIIDPKVLSNIMAFGAVYTMCFIVGSMVMMSYDFGLVTSMTASAAALGNVGPGLEAVGPTANWALLPDLAKWVMSLLMLMGRLELFSVLILFTGWAWRR